MAATTATVITSDFLVIGSGLAGMLTALKASEQGKTVSLVTKLGVLDCNSCLAQGGIACRISADDTFDSHVEDTLRAGAGICDRAAVEAIVKAAPDRVADLIHYGVRFTKREPGDPASPPVCPASPEPCMRSDFDLGREGGHSARRILHAGDITGAEIMRALNEEVGRHGNITVYTNHIAVDLLASRRMGWAGENMCVGAYVLDRVSQVVKTFVAKATVLATGGTGKVYLYTTNPDTASGDGIAMAWRAMADVCNMEFIQFHPSCLYHPKLKSFLISEALRGEGAKLKAKTKDGQYVEFMQNYHRLRDLAPRDIVARAIDNELKRSGEPCVYLDITHHTEDFLKRRFPGIYSKLMEVGINMATDLIPVVPSAHFCCGGIRTDTNGQTTISGLYAAGECAYTGLHGANRLASNSLLECAVVSHNAVQHAIAHPAHIPSLPSLAFNPAALDSGSPMMWAKFIPPWTSGKAVDSDEIVVIRHSWDEIRRFMWDYVGIYRTTRRLQRAKARVKLIRKEIEKYYWEFKIVADLVELRNLASVAEMIIDSALQRHESVGLHFNGDFPPVTTAAHPTGAHETTYTVLRRSFPVVSEFHVADYGTDI